MRDILFAGIAKVRLPPLTGVTSNDAWAEVFVARCKRVAGASPAHPMVLDGRWLGNADIKLGQASVLGFEALLDPKPFAPNTLYVAAIPYMGGPNAVFMAQYCIAQTLRTIKICAPARYAILLYVPRIEDGAPYQAMPGGTTRGWHEEIPLERFSGGGDEWAPKDSVTWERVPESTLSTDIGAYVWCTGSAMAIEAVERRALLSLLYGSS
jgi:hypothetical protein